jgi:hypothetical protein
MVEPLGEQQRRQFVVNLRNVQINEDDIIKEEDYDPT